MKVESLRKHAEKQRAKGAGPAGFVEQVAAEVGQYPTPEFAEVLMGFPAEWIGRVIVNVETKREEDDR